MSKISKSPLILGADDDELVRNVLQLYLEKTGISCEFFDNGQDLADAIDDSTLLCITDLNMPGMDGFSVLEKVKKEYPRIEVIILTGDNEAAQAISALRKGAFDYLTKPFDPDELIHQVKRAMSFSKSQLENKALKGTTSPTSPIQGFKGNSTAMKKVFKLVERLGPANSAILITGESGTGKTLIARSLHSESPRSDKPFITVSCPSLPRELLESEMFGHERGAFTGANERRLGRTELAQGGTLFLDEIGDMPLELQPKLLNFLQDKKFFRVGGQKELEADVRVVAATNRNLEDLVKKGTFREDLFFRLNVLPIHMPSLRDRSEDVPLLVDHFVSKLFKRLKKPPPHFHPETIQILMEYPWPGNVRELENVIERACLLSFSETEVTPEDLPDELTRDPSSDGGSGAPGGLSSLAGVSLAELEKQAIIETLALCKGNKAEASRLLGITEKSVYNKLKKYGL